MEVGIAQAILSHLVDTQEHEGHQNDYHDQGGDPPAADLLHPLAEGFLLLFLRLLRDRLCRDRLRLRLGLLRCGDLPGHLPKRLFAGGTLLQVLLHQLPAALGTAAVHIEGEQVLNNVALVFHRNPSNSCFNICLAR